MARGRWLAYLGGTLVYLLSIGTTVPPLCELSFMPIFVMSCGLTEGLIACGVALILAIFAGALIARFVK